MAKCWTGAIATRCALALMAILLALPLGAAAQGIWAGQWSTAWRDDGGRLLLEQQGDRVTGVYPLYGGRIEATATGRRLEGSWTESDQSGTFIFVMDREGQSFVGRYDDGEWWTGARSNRPDAPTVFANTNPRSAFREFIVSGNLARSGRPEAWGNAMLMVDFTEAMPHASRTEQLLQLQALFNLIDLATFSATIIPAETAQASLQVNLGQAGTDAHLTLTLLKNSEGHWRIRMPHAEELATARTAMLAALGGRPPAADAYRRMLNARDTMRSFLEGMADWNGPGRALALSALDMSAVPEVLRDAQAIMVAHYLRRALNQIGLIGLQSIPNDGSARLPYVHFSHPAGRIIIAPNGTEANSPWQFTQQTVLQAGNIFRALEGLPPPVAAPPGLIPDAPFFRVRDIVREHAPVLLGHWGSAEYWQILAGLLVLGMATLTGGIGAWVIRRGVDRLTGSALEPHPAFNWAVGIVIGLALASGFPGVIGAPEEIRRISFPILGMTMTIAMAIVLWRMFEILGLLLRRVSDRTATATDDILFTLLLATARLGVVVMAFLGVAHFLSIPTGGILAGLGIGGLAFAFASRETLSNVFGAGILVSDRPFRRGDWITSGEVEGAVEHVGIRSTRVRTAQDSVMVVPNGKLSDSTINNLGSRRIRLLKTTLPVTAGATPEALEAFTQAIRDRILRDEAFVADRTDIGLAGITEGGIAIELTSYLKVSTVTAERAAKHALLLDIVHLAEACGLTLGAGMLPPGAVPAA